MVRPPLTRNQVVLLVLIAVIGGGVFVWDNYFRYDPEKAYAKAEKEYIAAMTADTYGGQTPQETLDLFVVALRAEDIDLASKYFMLDKNLSREKWLQRLQDLKSKRQIMQMADDIQKDAKPAGSSYKNNFAFVLLNDDQTVAVTIRMRLNEHSDVWKIESM